MRQLESDTKNLYKFHINSCKAIRNGLLQECTADRFLLRVEKGAINDREEKFVRG